MSNPPQILNIPNLHVNPQPRFHFLTLTCIQPNQIADLSYSKCSKAIWLSQKGYFLRKSVEDEGRIRGIKRKGGAGIVGVAVF